MLRIATVNVNGIRAAARRGMSAWIDSAGADVLLLQEVRATAEQLEENLPGGWRAVAHPSEIKGRAGVAVAVREDAGLDVTGVRMGLAPEGEAEEPVDSGRWIEVTVGRAGTDGPDGTAGTAGAGESLTLVSAYLHSGQVGTPKMDAKYAHLERVGARLADLGERAAAGEGEALVCGDFNVVRSEKDIKNWKGNHNRTSGVLDDEIAHLERWFGELGWVDVHRELSGPDAQGPYTWWSWRGQAFPNDAGWRIDYHAATPGLAAAAREARVDKAATYDERFSDHAPLVVAFDR